MLAHYIKEHLFRTLYLTQANELGLRGNVFIIQNILVSQKACSRQGAIIHRALMNEECVVNIHWPKFMDPRYTDETALWSRIVV